jgi:hypothetical protein
MPRELLSRCAPIEYISAARRGQGGNYMRPPSTNAMVTGTDFTRAFRGPLLVGGKLGSRVLFNTDQTFAGLGTQAVNGSGSVFAVRSLLMAIGSGQVNFDGAAIATFLASSTLSYVKNHAAPVYQAGRAQPSAPLIFAKDNPSAGRSQMTGAASIVIFRSSDIDGQVSLMSLPSNVLTLSGQDVIAQLPAADLNGQNFWGIGVPKLGGADVENFYQLPTSLGGEPAESSLATIDGITRAVEISWTNGALMGQPLAPDDAFPPPAGDFAGAVNDVLFVDSAGIIYVGVPNYIGSFPPSQAIFASEPAIAYVRIADGVLGRFSKNTFGVLTYVGGQPALEFQYVWTHLGITHPQNVALGAHGRLLLWLGRPAVVESGTEPDFGYARKVLPDFDGWVSTTAAPVSPGYDPQGLYEVWCWQKKVMARYAPDGRWCAPQDLTGKIPGNIMAVVTTASITGDQRLYLSVDNGAGALALYEYDAGTGSTMLVQTDDSAPGYGDTITEAFAQVRSDNRDSHVLVELVADYEDDSPVSLFDAPLDEFDEPQMLRMTADILNARAHALRVTVTSEGGDAGVDYLETYGVKQGVRI